MPHSRTKLLTDLGAAILAMAVAAPLSAEPTEVKVWRHHEANEAELTANREAIERFNGSQDH